MAYNSYHDEKKAIMDLRLGKIKSIPCTECENGKILSNPNVPIKNQMVFYCDTCKAKIIFN